MTPEERIKELEEETKELKEEIKQLESDIDDKDGEIIQLEDEVERKTRHADDGDEAIINIAESMEFFRNVYFHDTVDKDKARDLYYSLIEYLRKTNLSDSETINVYAQ
jgi:chromosome segregation ATPase